MTLYGFTIHRQGEFCSAQHQLREPVNGVNEFPSDLEASANAERRLNRAQYPSSLKEMGA